MIAVLTIRNNKGEPVHCAMHDTGDWTCVDKDMEIVLNALYHPDRNDQSRGTASGFFGEKEVDAVFKRWGIKQLYRRDNADIPGMIY